MKVERPEQVSAEELAREWRELTSRLMASGTRELPPFLLVISRAGETEYFLTNGQSDEAWQRLLKRCATLTSKVRVS